MGNVSESIFKINTAAGSGSGFYVKEHDVIITNYHVVDGNREVSVENTRKERYLANVVMVNPVTDLAFLKCWDSLNAAGVRINEEIVPYGRDQIFVHGFPFGMPYTVTQGIISAPDQLMDGRHYLQTDAAVNPGNSGGPMLNHSDELVAVTTSKFNNADNVGFGIPLKTVMEELDTWSSITDYTSYSLKCDSCGALISEKVEYCNSCGSNVDTRVFAFETQQLSKIAVFVEEALAEAGTNPVLARNGANLWEFHHGSSLIRIFLFKNNYLYVTSPLNELPKGNLEPLLEYLLKDNVNPYKLGIFKDTIYVSYRVAVTDAFSSKADDIKKNIVGLLQKADELDDFFVDNYNCKMTSFSKIVENQL
ncbi:trypsin-like peptidase domain-containing protein [Sinomicrobium weinanense]|uniref:Trypsin-like peptidase domain-containing protein n=1 Tax=Sinomicrobium weinanense TaxID=2842200 RepID=A0A926JPL5_9FLAO|nr:trypsin-like peptidase domain-containing protein [Sinomicrobium weinanense]MBC9794988.1 trypsin-like peptidase domain-containing protein [Sinomicrobium weinanense]MBU3125151.1 trypsin-like peptidase domain-containing protein [Sinomicrobium weinanense]